jgi:hypothetical protein
MASYHRQVWEKFGTMIRSGESLPSWSEAYADIRGISVRDRFAQYELQNGVEHASPDAKRKVFDQLSQDEAVLDVIPEVVKRAVASDQPVAGEITKAAMENATPAAMDYAYRSNANRKALTDAGMRWHQENERRREEITQSDPVLKRLDQIGAGLDLTAWIDHVRKDVIQLRSEILPRIGRMPEAQKDPTAMRMLLVSALNDLDEVLEPIRNLARTGEYDLDGFLKEVLGGSRG